MPTPTATYQVDAMTLDQSTEGYCAKADAWTPEQLRTIHAALGLAGEAGEVVDLVKKHVFGLKPLDRTKLLEEIGDVLWYLALVCHAQGLDLESAMRTNIAKLRARYPRPGDRDKYVTRDVEAERAAMAAVLDEEGVE